MKYIILYNGRPAYDDMLKEFVTYDLEEDSKATVEDMRAIFPGDLWDYQPMTEEEIAKLPIPKRM